MRSWDLLWILLHIIFISNINFFEMLRAFILYECWRSIGFWKLRRRHIAIIMKNFFRWRYDFCCLFHLSWRLNIAYRSLDHWTFRFIIERCRTWMGMRSFLNRKNIIVFWKMMILFRHISICKFCLFYFPITLKTVFNFLLFGTTPWTDHISNIKIIKRLVIIWRRGITATIFKKDRVITVKKPSFVNAFFLKDVRDYFSQSFAWLWNLFSWDF